MYREPEAMKEIHQIQERLHEKMKAMTSGEKIGYINKKADELEEKYNLNLKKAQHVR